MFHEKLGTQAERIERIERLAAEIAPLVGADVEKAKRAAHLAKADLLTEVVGEFPELQGLMGKYYALAQGEDASVAAASEEHYKPHGPADRVPTDPVAIAVALADKIDTLVGFLGDRRKADRVARTRMRCGERRWASSGSSCRTICGSTGRDVRLRDRGLSRSGQDLRARHVVKASRARMNCPASRRASMR